VAELLYIDQKLCPLFPEGGRPDFWLDGCPGTIISQEADGRELIRIEADGQTFFLKRSGRESLWRHLRMLSFCCRPVSGALREVRILRLLRRAGFAAMEPVAWGQEKTGFLQVRGFLLTRRVRGCEVTELFEHHNEPGKSALMERVGRLVGQLHSQGFFHPVRLKDLISADGQLVLIDRETSKPWRSLFLKRHCLASIARSYRRTVRDGHPLDGRVMSAYLKGYRSAVSGRWPVDQTTLEKAVLEAVRKEMGACKCPADLKR